MARPSKYPVEFRARAVRMGDVHQEVLWRSVGQAERDTGQRPGLTTSERQRLKVLERENRELTCANDIPRKPAAYFAQAELDRPSK